MTLDVHEDHTSSASLSLLLKNRERCRFANTSPSREKLVHVRLQSCDGARRELNEALTQATVLLIGGAKRVRKRSLERS